MTLLAPPDDTKSQVLAYGHSRTSIAGYIFDMKVRCVAFGSYAVVTGHHRPILHQDISRVPGITSICVDSIPFARRGAIDVDVSHGDVLAVGDELVDC